MLSIEYITIASHKANAIDKRAISELKWRILSDIELYHLTEDYGITKDSACDESNYIIVEIEGYENIAYIDCDNDCIYEVVQPINRAENKLYPMQRVEIKPIYKRL
ncbi:MAG: hypothetical protein NC037_00325 [Bacteroides sp.]|nr:hypothetical protein [Bacillota bacterium]MCM1393736.1 hypothetical protein [[Eubacterium] siraeum]MCM1454963.1 hypothetical protein [Bacteroides sp.]